MGNDQYDRALEVAGRLHDAIHDAACLVDMEGRTIGWAPEDSIPMIAVSLVEFSGLNDLRDRVGHWIVSRIGADHMHSRERSMRMLEESVELSQAEGITREQVIRQVDHVFARPAGEPAQEAAGVAICLLGWCASMGVSFESLAAGELARIEAKPIDQIRGSLARKADADLVVVVPESLAQGRRLTPAAGKSE
jgi:hypothetical protein